MNPITPFESNGGVAWTTIGEEEEFLAAVMAQSTRVSRRTVGQSFSGLPIHAYTLRTNDPSMVAEGMLVIASQHGFEETPREAALQLIRDLAFTTDSALLDAMSLCPVTVVPTASPDGTLANTRFNGNGDDPNRSHVSLLAPEARALTSLIRVDNPLLVFDGHEAADRTSAGVVVPGEINFLMHAQTVSPIFHAWASGLYGELTTWFSDITSGEYPLADHEGTITNALASRGFPSVLVEVKESAGTVVRCGWHLRAMTQLVKYTASNRHALSAVREESQAYFREVGYDAHAPVYAFEAGYLPPAQGYLVPRPDFQTLDLLGIVSHPVDTASTTVYIPVDQGMSQLIPLLLDPRAPRPAMVATPVYAGDDAAVDFLNRPDPLHFSTGVRLASGRPRRLVTRDGIVWGS